MDMSDRVHELDINEWVLLMAIFMIYIQEMERLKLYENAARGEILRDKFNQATRVVLENNS